MHNFFLKFSLVLVLTIISVNCFADCRQSGSAEIGSVSGYYGATPDWKLMTGFGPRSHVWHITFKKSFCTVPRVETALKTADVVPGTNQPLSTRVFSNTINVTKDGFDLLFGTWFDTKIYGGAVSWFAVSE